jgi:hypothetical protein
MSSCFILHKKHFQHYLEVTLMFQCATRDVSSGLLRLSSIQAGTVVSNGTERS